MPSSPEKQKENRQRNLDKIRQDPQKYLEYREKKNAATRARRAADGTKEREAARRYYENHRETIRAKQKARYPEIREEVLARQRESYRWRTYGLTQDQFSEILRKQGGGCGICGKTEWGRPLPDVDHDHVTGKVRGLLCWNCNRGLGQFKDDLRLLRNAVRYMEAHETAMLDAEVVDIEAEEVA